MLLVSNFNFLWSEMIQCMISIFLHLLGLVYGLTYFPLWRMFHVNLRKQRFFSNWVESSAFVC